jgi:hypothetical protein
MVKKKDNQTDAELWFAEIDESLAREKEWRDKGEAINCRYRNDDRVTTADARYNILYSNTETMAPMLFSRVPEPIIRQRGNKSPAARDLSDLISGAIEYTNDENKVSVVFEDAVKDYQLSGKGQVRIKVDNVIDTIETRVPVEPIEIEAVQVDEETGEILQAGVFETPEGAEVDEETGELFQTEEQEELVFQEISVTYHAWDEWTHSAGSRWDDIMWVDYIGMMNKEAFEGEFGKKLAAKVPFTAKIKKSTRNKVAEQEPMVEVHEVWDKTKRQRFFMVRGYENIFDAEGRENKKDDDPLGLNNFFPSPAPLMSITTNDQMIPVPFFMQYEDQANQLDILTTRIESIVDNLRHRGVFDAQFPLHDLYNATDGEFIPLEDYAKLSDRGGLAAVWDTVPIQNDAVVLQTLIAEREQVLNTIFEIIGISDIMRGKTNPNEAAETNRIKGNFGTIRISKQQRQVQAFIRDTYELLGEALVENIDPQVLQLMTGVEVTPEMLQLMQTQQPRTFWIDIETDSTVVTDEAQEQQEAQELIGAIASFGEIIPILAQTVGKEGTKALFFEAFSKFRSGRSLEDTINKSIDDLEEEQEGAPDQPDPEMIKAQNEQQKLQLEAQKMQLEGQLKQAELSLAQQKLQIEAGKAISEDEKNRTSNALDAARLQLDQQKLQLEAVNPNKNIVREG